MYMYYFLGHRLWAQSDDARRKQRAADNTFVLALDGDVDFQVGHQSQRRKAIGSRILLSVVKRDYEKH